MPAFTDQLGRTITLERPPVRIISLVPSQTELLYTLGLTDEVAGITKFCVHPAAWFRDKPRIGGTKDVRPEKIAALKPDLIIANKEENDREQVEALAAHYPVWISDVKNLNDALDMIRSVGQLVGRPDQARTLAADIQSGFDNLAPLVPPPGSTGGSPAPSHPPHRRTAYLIWRNPWMAAGGDTFINDMLQRCGLTNILADRNRYPTIDPVTLAACDLVLLSSEPYPFREQHIREIEVLLPDILIRLVDGELFSWYGSRLLQAPPYFQQLLACLPLK